MSTILNTTHQSTVSGAKVTKTILHWQHRRGGEAHCLVRFYELPALKEKIVIASEIFSNPDGRGITSDFAGVATSILQYLNIQQQIANIIWLSHHGDFSYYDTFGEETFTRIDLHYNGDHIEDQLDYHHLLKPEEIVVILDGIKLEPVSKVLVQLNWHQK